MLRTERGRALAGGRRRDNGRSVRAAMDALAPSVRSSVRRAPEAARAARASLDVQMSPFTTTGIDDAALDRAHRFPVGATFIKLAAGSAMHRDDCTPASCARRASSGAFFVRSSQPRRILSVTGTDTAFDRRFNQGECVVEVAHQSGARLATGHRSCRTTHIDVDDGSAGSFGHTGRLPHPAGFAARKLNRVNVKPLSFGTQARIRSSCDQRCACDHLRNDKSRPKTCGQPPERCSRDA